MRRKIGKVAVWRKDNTAEEQVKRNQQRFPKNFMFQLTEKEVEIMVSQNAIPSRQHMDGAVAICTCRASGTQAQEVCTF